MVVQIKSGKRENGTSFWDNLYRKRSRMSKRSLSRWRSRGADRRAVQWGNPYIAYPQYSTSPNVARRARSRRPKSYGLPMPLRSTTPNVACYLRVSHATLRVTPLYHTRDTSLFTTYSSNSTTSSNRFKPNFPQEAA